MNEFQKRVFAIKELYPQVKSNTPTEAFDENSNIVEVDETAIANKIKIKMVDYELPSMNTASYPSGHSAQGMLLAKILSDKFPHLKGILTRTGKRISDSRRVAKAHYKSDSKLGELIGEDMYNHIKKNA